MWWFCFKFETNFFISKILNPINLKKRRKKALISAALAKLSQKITEIFERIGKKRACEIRESSLSFDRGKKGGDQWSVASFISATFRLPRSFKWFFLLVVSAVFFFRWHDFVVWANNWQFNFILFLAVLLSVFYLFFL